MAKRAFSIAGFLFSDSLLGHIVRAHWGIEINLHWVLDQAFDEDSRRARAGYSASNMAVMRH